MVKTATLLLLLLSGMSSPGFAQSRAVADVVVVVDTSTSMRDRGMDPERTSLLVSKLLADIVPGELAVVRLLDIGSDSQFLPSRRTGRRIPCAEDPSQSCEEVERSSDWGVEARRSLAGSLIRPSRGDVSFKRSLDAHLEQKAHNSMFDLAFRAAQGIFDRHQLVDDTPRTVVWLSDGRSENPAEIRHAISDLQQSNVQVEAVVFGRGDTRLARDAGLMARQTSTPGELMKAFAGVFRRIVRAPFEVDGEVRAAPSFVMQPRVDEAWIVVYGDDTLSGSMIRSAGGSVVQADYAQDRHPGAGAYRVAYVTNPAPGRWTVDAQGGGVGVAYAVVQRSGIVPVFIEPKSAYVGVPVLLSAALKGSDGRLLEAKELPEVLSLEAQVEDKWIRLNDDGRDGDVTAHDGKFSSNVVFQRVGESKVAVRARSALIDYSANATVTVTGYYRYRGGPLTIDFGRLSHHSESCRDLTLNAEHSGAVPFHLRLLRNLPSGHTLEIRTVRGVVRAGGPAVAVLPGDDLRICLVTGRAGSSSASGEPWTELRALDARVELRLIWQVDGMTFWELWGWLILLILGILLALFVIYGFIWPKRFQRALALTFVPDREEIDEQTPQPLAQWRGVGIGWYRNARAYLHSNYRVSGKQRGALVSLHAISSGTLVKPEGGYALFRETMDSDWEVIPPDGRSIRPGEVHRIGQDGPYFRTSIRMS